MDSINDVASIIMEQEDRISNLPDDIIHHILGFLDMKYAVQTSKLSRKWEHIWTSMPNLNFNSGTFGCMYDFGKFVEHALYYRDISAQVSEVEITFRGLTTQCVVGDIVDYGYFTNVRQLIMNWTPQKPHELPQWLFSSHTLKYLTLNDRARFNKFSRIPNSVWDFPALETLYLGNIRLGCGSDKTLDLFSKCVNLKELTLNECSMYGLEAFTVNAPQLSNLTITETTVFPMVFNVVAPKLKTLTASVSINGGMSPCFSFLRLSTEGFGSLEKVNLSLSNGRFKKENLLARLIDLFHILHNAKFLILDVAIIECLSSCLNQLANEPCPFDNLKFLKINTVRLKKHDPMPTVRTQVRNYILENSPTATFIMDLPQVYIKTMTEENTMLKSKVEIQKQLIASLMTKVQMKDQVISNHNGNIQTKHQTIAKQNAEIQILKSSNIHMLSDVPNPPSVPRLSSSTVPQKRAREQAPDDTVPKKVARSEAEKRLPETMAEENKLLKEIIQRRVQLIETLKTKLQKKDQVIENQKANMQMKDEIIAEKNAEIEMLKIRNIHKQSSVPAPPPVPRPFSSIVLHKIPREQVPNDTIPKKVAKLEAEKELPVAMAEKIRRLEAKIQMQYQVIADMKRELHIKDQVIANQHANIQMLQSSNIHLQSDIHTPPPVPRLASLNVATSSRHVWT